jgi:chromosome partitioning protein
MTLPRIASGRCRLATVGMRIDGRTNASQVLREWSVGLGMPYLGALRETQLYVRSLERGLTMFDLPPNLAAADLAQWAPIIDWMRPVLQPRQAANDPAPAASPSSRVGNSRPDSLMPAQGSLIHGSRLAVLSGARAVAPMHRIPVRTLPRVGAEGLEIPRLLKR